MEKDPPSCWKLEDNVDYKASESVNPEENGDSQLPCQEYLCYETDEGAPILCCWSSQISDKIEKIPTFHM